jgi:hypothetical protein
LQQHHQLLNGGAAPPPISFFGRGFCLTLQRVYVLVVSSRTFLSPATAALSVPIAARNGAPRAFNSRREQPRL